MMQKEIERPLDGSVDTREVERFAAIAEEWWDPAGKFKPLHKLNPARLQLIRDRAVAHFGLNERSTRPFEGLRLLDIGCGGGLLCEPMARLGAKVVGIDAAERNTHVAALHAEQSGLDIDYRFATAEALRAEGAEFDIVLNMEVVEHVQDVEGFLAASADLVRPGGLMLLSTLNRTARSFALGIVAAEYILRWLPRGTHDWRRFLKPSEVAAMLRPSGLHVTDVSGLAFDPLRDRWIVSTRDLAVNYVLTAAKPAA